MSTPRPSIVVTYKDMLRLTDLTQSPAHFGDHAVDALEDELLRAEMVSSAEVARDVVTMNSHVVYVDEITGRQREVVLSYPKDVRLTHGRISVLSPVGVALLGLRVGQTIAWTMPDGVEHRLRVLAVTYQPEASRDYEL